MEGHVEKEFAALQTANYPAATRTTVVALRAPLKEGELSLNAGQKQVFDLFFIHQGKLACRYLYWEPIVYRGDGHLQTDEDKIQQSGWLGQVGLYAYVCPTCAAQGRLSEKDIPSYSINKVARKNAEYEEKKINKRVRLECDTCQGELVRKTYEKGGLLPQLRPTPNQGLEDMLRSMVCGEPQPDIIPTVMGMFHPDEAPAVWTPQSDFQRKLADAAAAKNRVLLPYRMFRSMQVPQLKGLRLVCQPFACGPVSNDDLYKNSRSKTGHFQQILLGEKEEAQQSRWYRF